MSTLRERQAVFAEMIAKLIIRANLIEKPVAVLEWYRTEERQRYLVEIGRSKTMQSKHLIGLAVDLVAIEDLKDGVVNWNGENWKPLGLYWEMLGGKWGGRFGDNIATEKIEGWDSGHFEMG